MALDFAAVDDLVTALAAAGVRSVSPDPAKVNTPGIWVQVAGVGSDTLCASPVIRTRLVLVSPDRDPRRAMTALADLYNLVAAALDIAGEEATSATVTLPGDPTPLPALVIPFDLLT